MELFIGSGLYREEIRCYDEITCFGVTSLAPVDDRIAADREANPIAASSTLRKSDDVRSAQPGLVPSERRERIAEIVLANESVSARDLAARFDVSVMTIHRDLDELERRGVLRKI